MKENEKLEELEVQKPKKKRKLWLIIPLVLLALVVAAVLTVYGIFHDKYTQIYEPETTPPLMEIVPGASVPDYEQIVDADEQDAAEMDEAIKDLEEMEAVEATGEKIWDDDVYNILLLGTDERTKEGKYSDAARSDVCMLLSINLSGENPVISLVSFERGMGVPILDGVYEGQWDWLTHVFRYGGANLMVREIRECFKLDVDHYVRVNFGMFMRAIDAIGGVTVDVSSAEAAYLRSAGFNDIKTGKQLLDGNQALCYARIRKIDSDWVRITRQREVVQSALQKVGELPLPEMLKLVDTVLPMVKTNIPEDKMAELILLLPKLKDVEFQQMTIPAKGTYGGKKGMGGRSMYAADFNKNAKILQEFLYPQLSEKPDGE